MFPVITEIFEMILLKRLEDFTRSKSYFSPLQFGFKTSVGCLEASFVVSESVNHKLERSNKVFSCFLYVKKAFDTVWLDRLFFYPPYWPESLWQNLADSERHVHRSSRFCNLERLDIWSLFNRPGFRPGENHCPLLVQSFYLLIISYLSLAITLSRSQLRTSPWVAQHLRMIWLFWHFFEAFYSTSWVSFSISGLNGVTNLITLKAGSSYLENLTTSMPKNMMSRKFNLGLDVVKERKEYKNLGVTKNYAHSCGGDIDKAVKNN